MKNREILFIIKARNQARKVIQNLGTDLGNQAKAAGKAADANKRFSKATGDSVKKARKASKAIRGVGKSAKVAAKGNATFIASLRSTAATIAILDGPLGGISSRFSAMGTLFSKTGLLVGALVLGFGLIARSIGGMVVAGGDFEASQLKIQQLLITTGNTAGQSVESIENMAISIGESTLASTDGVREAAGKLITFRNIGKDVFKRTLMAAQDLASVGFGSLTESTTQLGKALQDPIKGLTSLNRSGVTFSDTQKRMITDMVESGKHLEAQRYLLEAIELQVGGAAKAMAGGLSGAIDTFGERLSRLGKNFAINSGLTEAFARIVRSASDVLQYLLDNLDRIIDNLKTAGKVFMITAKAVVVYKIAIYGALVASKLLNKSVITGRIGLVLQKVAFLAGGKAAKKFAVGNGIAATSLKVLGTVIKRLPFIGLIAILASVIAYMIDTRHELHNVGGEFISISGVIKTAWDIIALVFSKAWKSLTEFGGKVSDVFMDLVGTFLPSMQTMKQGIVKFINVFIGIFTSIPKLGGAVFDLLVEKVKLAFKKMGNYLSAFGSGLAALGTGNFTSVMVRFNESLLKGLPDDTAAKAAAKKVKDTYKDAISQEFIELGEDGGFQFTQGFTESAKGILQLIAKNSKLMRDQEKKSGKKKFKAVEETDAITGVSFGTTEVSAINGLVSAMFPLIAEREKFIKQQKLLGKLSNASVEQLATYGLTHDKVAEALERVNDKLLGTTNFGAAARNSLRDLFETLPTMAQTVGQAVTQVFSEFGTFIGNMVATGKGNFKELISSILADLARMAANSLFKNFIGGILGGIGGGISGGGGSFSGLADSSQWGGSVMAGGFHSGGMAGSLASARQVPKSVFASAPRLHTGTGFIKNGEYPAILKKGERVLNPKETQDYQSPQKGGMSFNFSPTIMVDASGGGGSGGGMNQKELDALGETLNNELKMMMEQKFQKESRQGGILHRMNRGRN